MKFIITTGHCDHEGQPPKPSDKTIEIIFGNVWRGPIGDIADAEREAWDAKETPEGAQAKADAAQQAATATAAEALKSHADDAEIHKTSEHIRADIVEDDIPMTIARTMDVDAGIATALDKAKAYTDDAVAGKAEAEATSTALAGKVDKVDAAGLMTDEERQKLEGVEAGANAYAHPESHPADMIADTGEKVIMTVTEREKLAGIEADANAYVLPTASVEVLGGIKVGNNLSMREDGTLDAEAGGGDTVTVSPDAGNTLEQRENGLFVPAGSGGSGGGGDISGIEIGTQNMVPAATLFTRTLDSAAEMQEMLPILADPSVMGDGTNRAFAMGEVPFVGRYITVDQPMASFAPGWQIVVFGFNPMNGATFDTYTKESNQWPEVYPKTYDLGEETLFVLGFILRKDNNTAFGLDELITPLFVVNRGNKTIGAASQYQPYPVLPVMPQILQSNIICTVQDGKFTGATNPPGGEVTILHYNVNDTGDEMIVYVQLKSNNYRATLTAYSFEEVCTEVTQGNPPGSSYPVPAFRIKIKTSIAKYTSGIALFFSYWAPGA